MNLYFLIPKYPLVVNENSRTRSSTRMDRMIEKKRAMAFEIAAQLSSSTLKIKKCGILETP